MPYLRKQQITLGWHDADLSLNCTGQTHHSLYLSAFTVEHHVRAYAQSYAWNQDERSAHEILILLNISTAVAASIIRCALLHNSQSGHRWDGNKQWPPRDFLQLLRLILRRLGISLQPAATTHIVDLYIADSLCHNLAYLNPFPLPS